MPFRFDLLEPGLALSAAPAAAADLQGQPFAAVLNVWDPDRPAYLEGLPPAVTVIHEPFEDGLPIPRAFLRRAVLELADHRRRGVPTLVHCQAGQSRSPTVIALYWMARDGLAWEEAYQRIRRTRPQAQPHPLLTDAETRAAVVGEVRALLAGDGGVLAAARADAAALRAAHRDRGPEPDRRTFDWNLIETGLGCGVPPQDPDDLGRAGFTALLQLEPAARRAAWGVEAEAIGLPDLTPVDPPRLAAAVARLHAWRAAGRTVLVACGDGKSRSALVIALYHVATRGWDLAGALWYLRHRRRGAWPRPQLLEGRTPAQLVEACRAAFPPSG